MLTLNVQKEFRVRLFRATIVHVQYIIGVVKSEF